MKNEHSERKIRFWYRYDANEYANSLYGKFQVEIEVMLLCIVVLLAIAAEIIRIFLFHRPTKSYEANG